MSDVLTAEADAGSVAKRKPAQPDVEGVDAEFVAQLVEQARSAGLQLTGEGGLLQQLTKRVLESALEGEITDHLDRRSPPRLAGRAPRRSAQMVEERSDLGRLPHRRAAHPLPAPA